MDVSDVLEIVRGVRERRGDRKTIVSGGCEGADDVWCRTAFERGWSVVVKSFAGHPKRFVGREWTVEEASKERLESCDETLRAVAKRYMGGRPFPKEPWKANYLRRNVLIVENVAFVVAVGKRERDGKTIDGGTAWGCYVAAARSVPVFFFDQDADAWFFVADVDYGTEGTEIRTMPPILRDFDGTFAAVGTRDLRENGRRAIAEIFGEEGGV